MFPLVNEIIHHVAHKSIKIADILLGWGGRARRRAEVNENRIFLSPTTRLFSNTRTQELVQFVKFTQHKDTKFFIDDTALAADIVKLQRRVRNV